MLRAEELVKRYGSVVALRGVSLGVRPGEVLAVLGPSGCGKTTLLRLIAGLDRPDGGRVVIDGLEASSPRRVVPPFRRGVSMIFQDLALWPHMTVRQQVAFALRNGTSPEELLREMRLEELGSRYPHELSGGERQRLAIARALALQPRYLLMDEPFGGLDPLLREELAALVRRVAREGVGVVYVTHEVGEALALADRLAVMRDGKLEQVGQVREVVRNPCNPFVRRFLEVGLAW